MLLLQSRSASWGFPTLQERDQVLNQLRADLTTYGDRILAAVLKDSAEYVETKPHRQHLDHLIQHHQHQQHQQEQAAPSSSPAARPGPLVSSVEVQTNIELPLVNNVEVQTNIVQACSWDDQAKEVEKELRKKEKKLKRKRKEQEKEQEKKNALMEAKEELQTQECSPTSLARSPTRSQSSSDSGA